MTDIRLLTLGFLANSVGSLWPFLAFFVPWWTSLTFTLAMALVVLLALAVSVSGLLLSGPTSLALARWNMGASFVQGMVTFVAIGLFGGPGAQESLGFCKDVEMGFVQALPRCEAGQASIRITALLLVALLTFAITFLGTWRILRNQDSGTH